MYRIQTILFNDFFIEENSNENGIFILDLKYYAHIHQK